ncbi:MAG: FAD/NAD(P)-binding protein, partial [Terracidiphilus sp.]
MASKASLVIVGGGCSGLLVAVQLLRRGFRGTLTIVEPRRNLGRGLAYSTPFEEQLLNVPAGKMSALPDEPSHFLDWLHLRGFAEAAHGHFAPRKLYGEYLEELLQNAIAGCAQTAEF